MSNMNKFGILLLSTAFIVSLARTSGYFHSAGDGPTRHKVVRMLHWHLEGGFEEGHEELFRQYENMHPDVKLEQIRVSGNANFYHIFITTKLLGGTAPDLVLLGREPDGYIPQYYLPLDPYVSQPNPYNKGTDLEDVPWRDTYIDGMEGGYREQYLSYYGAPKAVLTRRVYYNKNLLREILGTHLRPADILVWAAFARALDTQRQSAQPNPAGVLWAALDTSATAAIEQAARAGEAPPPERQEAIVASINDAMDRLEFFNAEAFQAAIADSKELQKNLAVDVAPLEEFRQTKATGRLRGTDFDRYISLRTTLQRRNRLAIETSFDGLIADSGGDALEPENFSQFIDVCQRILAWSAASDENRERNIVPVAAIGTWTSGILIGQYLTSTSAHLLRDLDINRNGRTGAGPGVTGIQGERDETYFALLKGRIDWGDPNIRAAFDMVDEVTQYFQQGFMGTNWDDGKFLFGQGNAVMMPTGAWETRSLMLAADEAGFELGAFPFPFPGSDHPRYGRFIAGPNTERGLPSQGEIGVYRFGKNVDVALDFLMFMTSQQGVATLSRHTLWYPSIIGAAESDPDLAELLEPFRPRGDGYFGGAAMSVGRFTHHNYQRYVSMWLSGSWTLDRFFEEYQKRYMADARQDILEEVLPPLRRHVASTEREIDAAFFSRSIRQRELAAARAGHPVPAGDTPPDDARVESLAGDVDFWTRRHAELVENQLNTIYDFAMKRHLMKTLDPAGANGQ